MNLPKIFKNYLIIKKTSPVTAKNYLADVNHFLNWLARKTGVKYQIIGKGIFGLFTQETLSEYKSDLLSEKTPFSTLNRRLSALRKFGQFGKEQDWLKENPAYKISNANQETTTQKENLTEQILLNFQHQLIKEKASQPTIKNYLSDLKHFLNWIEAN